MAKSVKSTELRLVLDDSVCLMGAGGLPRGGLGIRWYMVRSNVSNKYGKTNSFLVRAVGMFYLLALVL